MKSIEIKAAVSEAGFTVKASTLWALHAVHIDTGAELRARQDRNGFWRFTLLFAGGTCALTPTSIADLIYLLTVSFSADARGERVAS